MIAKFLWNQRIRINFDCAVFLLPQVRNFVVQSRKIQTGEPLRQLWRNRYGEDIFFRYERYDF